MKPWLWILRFYLLSLFWAGWQIVPETQTEIHLTDWQTQECRHHTGITIEGRNDTDKDIQTITLVALLYKDGQVWKRTILKDEARYGFSVPAHSPFAIYA